jgi:uncharacterized membrane protein YeaQ/YmgE (transglycosylase-associated protein family)
MSGILWIIAGGVAGWLTGKLLGKKGYGAGMFPGYAKMLDIFFGIIGASIGGYLFFWIVVGQGGSFSYYATAVLGAILLVGLLRQISPRASSFHA